MHFPPPRGGAHPPGSDAPLVGASAGQLDIPLPKHTEDASEGEEERNDYEEGDGRTPGPPQERSNVGCLPAIG